MRNLKAIASTFTLAVPAGIFLFSASASAAHITIDVNGSFHDGSGTMSHFAGQAFNAQFTYDTDLNQAAWVDLTPGQESGAELGNNGGVGFGPDYGVSVTTGAGAFQSTNGTEYNFYDNQQITIDQAISDETGVPVGTYTLDGIEIFGGMGYVEGDDNPDLVDASLVTGTEMGLSLFTTENWYEGQTLLGAYDYLEMGQYLHAEVWGIDKLDGVEIGAVSGSINSITVSASEVPVPGAVWLFGSGILGLVGLGKYRRV